MDGGKEGSKRSDGQKKKGWEAAHVAAYHDGDGGSSSHSLFPDTHRNMGPLVDTTLSLDQPRQQLNLEDIPSCDFLTLGHQKMPAQNNDAGSTEGLSLEALMTNERVLSSPAFMNLNIPEACQPSSGHEILTFPVKKPENAITQSQHSRGIPIDIFEFYHVFYQQRKSPVNSTFRLTNIKGQVPAFCVNPNGSQLIQQAFDTATAAEIIIVYEEIMPYVRALVTDGFASYVIHKLLENGPAFYKRKLISCLNGHVISLSCQIGSSKVIQKAFEVGDLDQKVAMARELRGRVLYCACHERATHVIQKCIDCVPAHHIEFIFRSFCGNIKALATDAYGCHVLQKVLFLSGNARIYHSLMLELIETVTILSADKCGNYIVQHIMQHGGPIERSNIVNKFSGRVMGMSYDKFASRVIEKSLTFGSYQDRQLIINEILSFGGGQHFDYLKAMMVHVYANVVILKMVATAEERQLAPLVEEARRNVGTLKSCPLGKRVVSAIEMLLSVKAGRLVVLEPSVPVPPGDPGQA